MGNQEGTVHGSRDQIDTGAMKRFPGGMDAPAPVLFGLFGCFGLLYSVSCSGEVSSSFSAVSASPDELFSAAAFRSAFRLAFSSRRSFLARSLRCFSKDGFGFAKVLLH